ncbi:MAG: CDP-alcohol phosphatidyltransferase family protein [Gammaproteobacteria bacterium]
MSSADRVHLTLSAALHCAAGLALTAAVTWLGQAWLNWPPQSMLQALVVFAAIGAVIMLAIPRQLPLRAFGSANRVTLLRAALVACLCGLLGSPVVVAEQGWLMCTLALAASALDAVDGWLARRSGATSRFGARFDMEIDALFILVLAVLVWQTGRVGAWIWLAGGLRYLFLAAGWLWPWLGSDLPASKRRQTVCVVQILVLITCLSPPMGPFLSVIMSAGSLVSLVASFAIDVIWLARLAKPRSKPTRAGIDPRWTMYGVSSRSNQSVDFGPGGGQK